jgi:hypothetical protein
MLIRDAVKVVVAGMAVSAMIVAVSIRVAVAVRMIVIGMRVPAVAVPMARVVTVFVMVVRRVAHR